MTSITDFTSEQLADLDQEALIAITLELRVIIARQEAQIQEQAAQIQELQDQLAKNSQNSGKPPSSDGLKKPRTRSLREKKGRQSGGQEGHKGHTLEMVEQPDHVVVHAVASCPHCAADLREVAPETLEKRQVFDIPLVQVEVTEHQVEIKHCACGQVVKANFPPEVTQPVQYGSRLKAQAVYLNNYQLIPLARTCELIEDFYGHSPSEGLIVAANATFVEKSEPTLDMIEAQLIKADVAHADESGLRVEGSLHWLHVVSTALLTHYTVHPKRGQEAMRAIGILSAFSGRLIHDCWASYFTFINCLHGLCNAHILRELQFIVDQYDQTWAYNLGKLLLDIKAEIAATPSDQMALSLETIASYEQSYDELLKEGFKANPPPEHPPPQKPGRKKQTPPKNLLDRLQKYKPEILAFMHDFRVPFDNNLAERDVRMIKVKQKISGAFRTQTGADTFCAIRSYISTVRKQGGNVIQAIYDAFNGQPFIPLAEG
jgi:transposase